METGIGGFSLSVVLFVILTIIYKVLPAIPDRYKSLIAVACGVGLGMVEMVYHYSGNMSPITVKVVIDYILTGLMVGAAAVGIYEGQRTITNPRE